MATTEVKTTFQFKRGSAQRWIEVNPILKQGEPGFEYDTNKLKIGDGITPWNDLPYQGNNEIISVEKLIELPINGKREVIYKVGEEKLLYQWNNNTNSYEPLNEGGFDPTQIKKINGGNANG